MTLGCVATLPTALALEIANGHCFRSPAPHQVRLNGVEVLVTNRNSFTLRGLKSDTEYHVEVESGGQVYSLTARTKPLTAMLDPCAFGAKGDGVSDDTRALQATLSACPPDGLVRLTDGEFVSGPLFLKSRTRLEVTRGASLLGLRDMASWPVLPATLRGPNDLTTFLGSWEGEPLACHAGLLNILSAEDIMIYGEGTIDGRAGFDTWWSVDRIADEKQPERGTLPGGAALGWRPRLIYAVDSHGLTFEGVTLANSPSWTLHPLHCTDVRAVNLSITAPADSPNTDGLNPESCTGVTITGVHFTVGDDCIALKSGKISMARLALRPTRDVTIANCHMQDGHGAVVIGSEMASGVYDVHIRDCLFTGTDRGLRVKTRRGRGKDAIVRNIRFDNIRMDKVGTPFVINSFYWCDPDGKSDYVGSTNALPVDDGTPSLGGFTLTRIHCTGVRLAAAWLLGLPEQPINGLTVDGFFVRYAAHVTPEPPDMAAAIPAVARQGIHIRNARHVRLDQIDIAGQDGETITLESVS
ncbi:MAG: glycoside hydrolase family 28 protein [Asticcacaulis sp.]|nr:glycoside hydrolase family 28 protein [Asticcacaulis sp.]